MIKKIPTGLISFFLNLLLLVIIKTSRIKIEGEGRIRKIKDCNLPMLMCVWHGRLLFPCIWAKIKNYNPWIVASNNRDAQIIVNIFKNGVLK